MVQKGSQWEARQPGSWKRYDAFYLVRLLEELGLGWGLEISAAAKKSCEAFEAGLGLLLLALGMFIHGANEEQVHEVELPGLRSMTSKREMQLCIPALVRGGSEIVDIGA
jgi:hypothetical protein